MAAIYVLAAIALFASFGGSTFDNLIALTVRTEHGNAHHDILLVKRKSSWHTSGSKSTSETLPNLASLIPTRVWSVCGEALITFLSRFPWQVLHWMGQRPAAAGVAESCPSVYQGPIQHEGQTIARLRQLLFHDWFGLLQIVMREGDACLFHVRPTGEARQLAIRHLL